MRKLLVILALCAFVSSAFAGGHITRRMSDGSVLTFKRHLEKTPLGSVSDKLWDANKTYRVPVVLFSFADCDFIKIYVDLVTSTSKYYISTDVVEICGINKLNKVKE